MTAETRRFLTGRWTHLAMVNFACPAKILEPLVPAGTTLDRHGDTTQVSLVGFMFRDTRLRGVPVPFHRTFEEVNLRFYVRREAPEGVRRGVVFVRELVPKRALATVARLAYQERYLAVPMAHRIELDRAADPSAGRVEYTWRFGASPFRLGVTVDGPLADVPVGSEAEFITEHYWGYVAQRGGSTVEYAVEHPRWRAHAVRDVVVEGDFAALYGEGFGRVLSATPMSAFLAEGSEIVVRRGRTLPAAVS